MRLLRWLRKQYRERIRHQFHVSDYGAVGDGIIDDTEAVQAAADGAAQSNTAVTLYFKPGTFRVKGLQK